MSNKMIERVAESIWSAMIFGDPKEPLVKQDEQIKNHYKNVAKATIEAMREPTEVMVKAGYDEADGSHLWREVWKVMIDEALKDD